MPDGAYVEWQKAVIADLWRLTAPGGAIFYNHKPQLRDGAVLLPTRYVPDHVTLRQVIIWDRRVGMNWNASFFCPQHEWVLLLAHPEFRLTSRGASAVGDVWRLGIDQAPDGHPCAFPESLPARAIESTSARCILDPFAGSGTTLATARRLGRKAIGVEKSERYCEIAARRLSQGVFDFGDIA
jgi:modification methylase